VDNADVLYSYIEGAEDEFRQYAGVDTREARVGIPGRRETFEHVTYKVSGHENFKENWTGVSDDYLNQQAATSLAEDMIQPFDPDEGDEAYIYRGLSGEAGGEEWENVTDDYGELWEVVDHRDGVVAIHPLALDRARRVGGQGIPIARSRQTHFRLAICYRHGTLGRSRSGMRKTELTASLSDSQTGAIGVEDAAALSRGVAGGSLTLLVGQEYVRATLNRDTDEIDVLERGVRGTATAEHDSGTRVQYVPPTWRKAVAARAGIDLLNGGRYEQFLPENESDLDKGDIMGNLEDVWDSAVEGVGE